MYTNIAAIFFSFNCRRIKFHMQLDSGIVDYIAEFSGTALVSSALGIELAKSRDGLAFSTSATMAFIYTLAFIAFNGNVSTGFNPAVTLVSTLVPGRKQVGMTKRLITVLVQLVAALIGVAITRALYLPYDEDLDIPSVLMGQYRRDDNEAAIFVIHWLLESISVAGLVLFSLRIWHDRKPNSWWPLFIGFVYYVPGYVFRVYSGAFNTILPMAFTLNPAVVFGVVLTRSAGSISVADSTAAVLFPWTCQVCGALLGVALWRVLQEEGKCGYFPPYKLESETEEKSEAET